MYPAPGAEFPGESICMEGLSSAVCSLGYNTYNIRTGNLGDVLLSVHTVAADLKQGAEVMDDTVQVHIVSDVEKDDVASVDLAKYVRRWRRHYHIVFPVLEIWGHAVALDHDFYRAVLLFDDSFDLCKRYVTVNLFHYSI